VETEADTEIYGRMKTKEKNLKKHGHERKAEADAENKNIIWIRVSTGYSEAISMRSKKTG
jgi:hypothetical protein